MKKLYTVSVNDRCKDEIAVYAFVSFEKRNWFVETLNRVASDDFEILSNEAVLDEEENFQR